MRNRRPGEMNGGVAFAQGAGGARGVLGLEPGEGLGPGEAGARSVQVAGHDGNLVPSGEQGAHQSPTDGPRCSGDGDPHGAGAILG